MSTSEPRTPRPDVNGDTAMDRQVGGNHYKNLVIQPIEYCQRNQLNYCESNVVKYVTRHKFKNGAEDIRKAIHNLELLLQMEYPEAVKKESAPSGYR